MLKLAKYAALATALMAGPAFAADKTAATVNGTAIPQARVDAMVREATSQGQPDSPELRKAVLDRLINIEVLSQEAAKNGLDKKPEVAAQMELARQSTLAGAYLQDYAKDHPISEDAIKQAYDNLKGKLGSKEYRVAHILVATKEDAMAVEAQLKKKVKFETIAKEKSMDPGSKQNGGELPGWHTTNDFVEPFSNAMKSLKKGQVSEPVQTQYGWHIIKLLDERNLTVPPFEQVRDNLKQDMQRQAVQKLIADLRKSAKIEGVPAE